MRLHFEDGLRLERPPGNIEELIRQHREHTVIVDPGEYDLTPLWWAKHHLTHILKVFPRGNAIYVGIPRGVDVGTMELTGPARGRFVPGGRLIRLPEDEQAIIVAGPRKDRQTAGIYEIVFYLPGFSFSRS